MKRILNLTKVHGTTIKTTTIIKNKKKNIYRHSGIEFIVVREMKSAYCKTESKNLHYCIEPRQKSVKFPFQGNILNAISTTEIPQKLDEIKILIQSSLSITHQQMH